MIISPNISYKRGIPYLYRQVGRFTTVSPLFAREDKERLMEDATNLREEFDRLDGDIEEFTEAVKEAELNYSDDPEDTTELSKLIDQRSSQKDDLVGKIDDQLDYERDDWLQGREKETVMMKSSDKSDIDTLKSIASELDESDDLRDEAYKLIERLENHLEKAENLEERFYHTDLPPIRQDSSDVHRTDFTDPTDYYED